MTSATHLPVEDYIPDQTKGQLMISIHNIWAPYIYQINLLLKQKIIAKY